MDALRASVQESHATEATCLDRALAALKPLVVRDEVGEEDWVHASRLLREAAIERRHSFPRVASVALLVADALMFTEVGTVAQADRVPLRFAVRLLSQRFISTEEERELLRGLLHHGWYVTPSFNAEVFSNLA